MTIAGLPGASDPSFRTRDNALVSFDTLVGSVVDALDEAGRDVSHEVVKATIQCARHVVCSVSDLDGAGLAEHVMRDLRRFHILLVQPLILAIIASYAQLVAVLDIAEVHEGR
ncbi:MAG: hypothetical protein GY913_08805 [Proteobacteria bacterium]|nr:hypothetical protein [Pseudomonadota bacterium]MCP4917010.1 hypothetical protein [Pseudomonadota bacterium]